MANRLSADPSVEVVVLEAGPRDKDKFIHIPAGFAKLFRSEMDWDYLTEPQKELDGREIYWPRGKMLGGSSSMNAMMWVRGFAARLRRVGRARRRAVELRQRRGILQPHRERPAGHLAPTQSQEFDGSLADCRAGVHRCTGGVLRDPRHSAQGCPLEHRRRVPQTGVAAAQSDIAHRRHRDTGDLRRKACHRCGIRAAWCPPCRYGPP